MSARAIPASGRLPATTTGARATGWWGMVLLVATEATLFACLLTSYFYLRASNATWPLGDIEKPSLLLPGILTVILLSSSAPMHWAERSIRRGDGGRLALGLAISFLLGATFLSLQVIEYSRESFTPQTNAYGSLFFTITGLHGAHVLIGLLMSAVVQLRTWLGQFTARRHLAVQNVALYWHFVDAVWVFVFLSLYVSPHLLPQ
ncbi:MAG TPA: cytochrome c oxidase subunit 3 [Chloroflexota bacterium]|jgi:heme/copper-type cytochrome/quinol oxidase subunit 3